MYQLLLEASAAGAEAAGQAAAGSGMGSMLLPMIGIVAVMYFLMIRPQKKKEKEAQAMRSNIEVGDEIITIGGIVGRVVSLKDDTIVIETGSDRSKMRLLRSAVSSNTTAQEAAAQAAADAKKQKALEKEQK